MACSNGNVNGCSTSCNFNIKSFGLDDVSRVTLNGRDRTLLNWSQISIPEILNVPLAKPDIENLDQVYLDVNLTSLKLVETPYAYRVYDRLATELEIAAVQDIIDAVNLLDIDPITTAVEAILALLGNIANPLVAALQAALTAVEVAFDNVTSAVGALTDVLDLDCITASALEAAVIVLQTALNLLIVALNALIAAANALLTALGALFPLLQGLITTLLNAINVVITAVNSILALITSILGLFGATQYFALIANEEGTLLSGRKLIVEGNLNQKVVYTALVPEQSVHSACFEIPFSAYVIAYAKFEDLEYVENVNVVIDPATCETGVINGFPFDPNNPPVVDLCETFSVTSYTEDIFAYALDDRTIFKNVTLFLWARPTGICN